ncbi:MAG TPA: hypothetical protein VM432_07160 [Bdellovibrionales bacterium]|nr:hypothetical protein [Bdellovibrionales bacterium]
MKSVIGLLIVFFGVQASAAPFVCQLEKSLEAAPSFENVNDFEFSEYPYLLLDNDAVTVGALPFEEDSNVVIQRDTVQGADIIDVRDGDSGETILRVTVKQKTALVESFDSETAGAVALFSGCHLD